MATAATETHDASKPYSCGVTAELIDGAHEYEIDQVLKTLRYFNEIQNRK